MPAHEYLTLRTAESQHRGLWATRSKKAGVYASPRMAHLRVVHEYLLDLNWHVAMAR